MIWKLLSSIKSIQSKKVKIVNYGGAISIVEYYLILNSDVSYVDIDECATTPCQNGGSCYDEINNFTCQCAEGWTGDTCLTGNLK